MIESQAFDAAGSEVDLMSKPIGLNESAGSLWQSICDIDMILDMSTDARESSLAVQAAQHCAPVVDSNRFQAMLSGDSALDVESTFSADLQAPSLPGPISPHGSYCDKDDEQCSGAVRSDENNKGKKKRGRGPTSHSTRRAKQRRIEEVMTMTKEVSKLSSQNQLIVTKLTSLIQKIGSAADENRSLRSLLFTLSKSTQTKNILHEDTLCEFEDDRSTCTNSVSTSSYKFN